MKRIGSSIVILLWVLLSTNALAAEEKVLNIYNWADYIGETTLADFEREYGIRVNYDIYDAASMVDAKLMAGNSGYDVVIHAAGFSSRLQEAGIFLELVNQTSSRAVLSAIEVLQANPGGVVTPTVNLEVSVDDGATWTLLAADVPLDRFGVGQFLWTAGPETQRKLPRKDWKAQAMKSQRHGNIMSIWL